jgi:hypothetical protein
MKAQLVRVKSAATKPAALKVSELEDLHRNIDVLLARLQSGHDGNAIPFQIVHNSDDHLKLRRCSCGPV